MVLRKKTSSLPAVNDAPRHIAMIMDGNGRWANARGLPRKLGHQRGAETLKSVLTGCRELGIQYLTIYAFSSENWNRSEPEVNDLMELMRFYLRKEVKSLHENNIRLQFIGDQSRLSPAIQKELKSAETLTQRNHALHLTVALSYGSRQELMKAIRAMAVEIASGKLMPDEIDEYTVLAHLDTSNLPDPDLLIRTGGDMRLSNFLLWQSAYTELYFTPTLWPDFTKDDLAAAVSEYGTRERRFGARVENI